MMIPRKCRICGRRGFRMKKSSRYIRYASNAVHTTWRCSNQNACARRALYRKFRGI